MKTLTFLSLATVAVLPLCQAATFPATVNNGLIHDAATWNSVPEAPPTSGDTNTWESNSQLLRYNDLEFFGQTFVLDAGSTLEPEGPGDDPVFQNFTFNGGKIRQFRNLGSTFQFGSSNVAVSPAGGLLEQVAVITQNRDLWFSGGVWTGSGTLTFTNPAASDNPGGADIPTFRFLNNVNLSAFTGTLAVVDKAILEIEGPISTPTFTLELHQNARYDNIGNNNISVSALNIDGIVLPPADYQVGNGSLTPTQEAFILTSGTITVGPGAPSNPFLDTNSNGIHDFVEISNPGIDFSNPTLDTDGDGFPDYHELISNTDPTNPQSFIACETREVTATDVTVGFEGSAGVDYQLQWSPDLIGWINFGAPHPGINGDNTVTMSFASLGVVDPTKLFFRMGVLGASFQDDNTDGDSDGLTNAVEAFTLMFNPAQSASMRAQSNGGDQTHLEELLRGINLNESLTDTSYAASISPENAARFLFQAGFGPNDDDILTVQTLGYSAWIDAQLTLPKYSSYNTFNAGLEAEWAAAKVANGGSAPANNTVAYRPISPGFPQDNLSTLYMRGVVHGDDILRQKSVWALLQIIVSSGAGFSPRYAEPCAVYIDLFHDGAFGTYEDLLYNVAINGHMGNWLSHINNKKANPSLQTLPDENFAREIMQLFTIGLFQMNPDGSYQTDGMGAPIPTYGFDDVAELAKVFTGLKGTGNGTTPTDIVNWNFTHLPMYSQESDHDVTAKSLLNGYLVIPANMLVKDEVRLVCEKLVEHPNCAPFVATRLIQNLVTSNPTAAYVERISTVFTSTDGDLGDVIKAILLDPEARGPRFLFDPLHGKLREPLMRFTSLVQAFEVGTTTNSDPYNTLGNLQFWSNRSFSNQAFFESPSVFNFFQSEFQEPGEIQTAGLVSPEFQLLDATTNLALIEQVRERLVTNLHVPRTNSGETEIEFEMLKEISLLNTVSTHDDLIDRLSLLMTGGLADAEARADYSEPIHATGTFGTQWSTETDENRVKYAVLKLFADSSSAVQR